MADEVAPDPVVRGRAAPSTRPAPSKLQRLMAWRLRGLPPGLGVFGWLASASVRMPGASGVALFVTWTALIFSLWIGVFAAIASVFVVIFGVAVSGHALGIVSFTGHTGTSLDLLTVLGALFAGFWVGFVHSYAVSLTSGLSAVALALLIGIVIGFVVSFVAMVGEPTILRWKGYRRPSSRERDQHLEAAVEAVQEAMQLRDFPRILMADTHVPLAWTFSRHVVLSTGLIETMDTGELNAILAHEIAHWRRGDPIALRMVWAFSWPTILLYNIGMILSGVSFGTPKDKPIELGPRGHASILSFVGWLFLWPSYLIVRFLIAPTTAAGSRRMEYDADTAAALAGWDGPMVRALEKLSTWEPGRTAWESVLSASHPPTALRIEAVETLDADAEVPTTEHINRKQLERMGYVVVILLVLALGHLIPIHSHHHSWWNPFGSL